MHNFQFKLFDGVVRCYVNGREIAIACNPDEAGIKSEHWAFYHDVERYLGKNSDLCKYAISQAWFNLRRFEHFSSALQTGYFDALERPA